MDRMLNDGLVATNIVDNEEKSRVFRVAGSLNK